MRGEYVVTVAIVKRALELPPRARRIRQEKDNGDSYYGTTSACAENTQRRMADASDVGNYLRVRGEYTQAAINLRNAEELPPRARRIPNESPSPIWWGGTTSACAENTVHPRNQHTPHWNYLRVRGEYLFSRVAFSAKGELPPRARRIPLAAALKEALPGTTSACAENTCTVGYPTPRRRNYLRVRGEYFNIIDDTEAGKELPPRARRIP